MKTKILIYLLFPVIISAQSTTEATFNSANKLYLSGKYDDAMKLYKIINNSGYESFELYYNIGNTFFKLNKYDLAIAYYEKAIKINHGNELAIRNLNITKTKINANIEELPEYEGVRIYKKLILLLPYDLWFISFFIFIIICTFVVRKFINEKNYQKKKKYFIVSVVLLLLMISNAVVLYSYYDLFFRKNYVVIINEDATVYNGNKKIDSTEKISKGVKCEVISTSSNLLNIKLPDGRVVWINNSNIIKI